MAYVHQLITQPFQVVAEPRSRETYRSQDFKLSPRLAEDSVVTPAASTNRQSAPAAWTQSERDWKWALRHIQQGEPLETVIQTLAAYRDDKANPEYYARRTVTRAYAKVALTEGADPEDMVRTLSAHPPRPGMNGEQYARTTVEEFQEKLGRANQQVQSGPARTTASHQHAQQLGE